MYTTQNIYYKCSSCGKMILKMKKALHNKNCKPKKINKNMSIKDISKNQNFYLIFYICEICGEKMSLKQKSDHLLCHELEYHNKEDIEGIDFNFCDNNMSFSKSKITDIRYNNNYRNMDNNINDNSSSDSGSHRRRRNRRNSMDLYRRNDFDFSYISSSNSSSSSSSYSDNTISSKINEGLDDEIIKKYPEGTIKSVKKLSADKKKCLICLEKFVKGQKTIALPCIHIFHSECIKQWMKKKNFCPICKNKIVKKK